MKTWTGMRSGKGGGRKGGGGPILISTVQRTGGSTASLEASAGDAYYNNPNVSAIVAWPIKKKAKRSFIG